MTTSGERAEAQRAVLRARHAASQARIAAAGRAYRETLVREMFALPVRDCAHRCIGRPVRLLRAGYLTSLDELGLPRLREAGFEIAVVTVDEQAPPSAGSPGPAGHGHPAAALARAGEVIVGDLRTIAIPPRSFDIIHCALLLDRVSHVELVMDRFTAALRPGGLFLLRIRDRDCAAGLADRIAPQWLRRPLWRRLHPGEPGPFRAVYEPAGSDHGIQAYMQRQGLVICQRETAATWAAGPGQALWAASAVRGLIARLTRGRLTDAHDEVLYVIRKPQDRSARLV
ncbi:MAG: class I SAM-dependent methyltransferase [Actinomycetota bacterium]|nr:class I SAM-dependent methyltransferase [Actinomycetota bacterium]